MKYEVILAPSAARQFKALPAYLRSQVRDRIERHLRQEPTRTSKSRIKRLRGINRPQYRLRVGEIRVFYDVTETEVQVLAIIKKDQAQKWLEEENLSDT